VGYWQSSFFQQPSIPAASPIRHRKRSTGRTAYANSGVGNQLAYQLPVADGTYTLRLHFAEPSYTGVGQRTFDIRLQGEMVVAAYDIVADAGARYKATAREFTVTVSDGEGFALRTGQRDQQRGDPGGDRDHRCQSGWAWPTDRRPGRLARRGINLDDYRQRPGHRPLRPRQSHLDARRGDGRQHGADSRPRSETGTEPEDTSDAGFPDRPGGERLLCEHSRRCGPDGQRLHDGCGRQHVQRQEPGSPDGQPGRPVQRVRIGPGDVVYVDTGSYRIFRNITLLPEHSGVRVEGPAAQGAAAVLDRGNTSAGSYVFELAGATDVTLSGLGMTGAHRGVFAGHGAGNSRNLTVMDSRIYGHAEWGIWLGCIQ
jgi:hypothetical protein